MVRVTRSSHSHLFLSLTLGLALAVTGCSKESQDPTSPAGGENGNTPQTPVPPQMVGMWFAGTIGWTNFYNPATGAWNNSRGMGMFYKLNAEGTFEYGWQADFYQYGCSTRGMVYKRGTVVVDDSLLTFYDTYGRAMGDYSCAPSSNFDRPDPLKTYTLVVQPSQDGQGNPVLLIRSPEEPFVSYQKVQ